MTTSKTRQFVKYRNRKIHAVGDDSPYVTMEELLGVVAEGTPVQITDDQTGEDITAYVLARLVFDRARMDKRAYTVKALQALIMSNPPPKKTGNKAA